MIHMRNIHANRRRSIVLQQILLRKVKAVTLVYDSFTDVSLTLLPDHTPDIDLEGLGWVDASGNWKIYSGTYVGNGIGTGTEARIDSGDANVSITSEVKSTTATGSLDNGAYLAVRVDETDHWAVGIHAYNDKFYILEWDGVAWTERASASVSINTSTYYTTRAVAKGTTITATLEGANQISYGSATRNQSETRHGLCGYMAYFDDFRILSK